MKKLYCPECSAYLEGGDGECKDCHCGWLQPAEEAKESALEQIQEENEKLKRAIIHMYRCKFQSEKEKAFYLVDHSSLNYAYSLTKQKD